MGIIFMTEQNFSLKKERLGSLREIKNQYFFKTNEKNPDF